jgi:hypothetical protein
MKELNGTRMLRAIGKYEDKCERRTERRLPRMGKKAPACYEYLGQVLAYADMIGSCVYGCPGPSEQAHALWYLVARTSSFGRAALRLAKMGFYDEALIIVRSIGEIANLVSLFSSAPEAIDEWKKSDRASRIREFSPARVRKRIVSLGGEAIMDETNYAALCEVSTHPVPDLRPQSFNHAGRSMTGGVHVQEAGFLVILNETALVTSLLVAPAAELCKVPVEPFKEIQRACAGCARSAGSVKLQNVRSVLQEG